MIALTKLACPNRLLDISCTSGSIALTSQYSTYNGEEAAAAQSPSLFDDPLKGELSIFLTYGFVTVAASNVTAVCANALPFRVAPVCSTIAV